jgi:hypothetical protein
MLITTTVDRLAHPADGAQRPSQASNNDTNSLFPHGPTNQKAA